MNQITETVQHHKHQQSSQEILKIQQTFLQTISELEKSYNNLSNRNLQDKQIQIILSKKSNAIMHEYNNLVNYLHTTEVLSLQQQQALFDLIFEVTGKMKQVVTQQLQDKDYIHVYLDILSTINFMLMMVEYIDDDEVAKKYSKANLLVSILSEEVVFDTIPKADTFELPQDMSVRSSWFNVLSSSTNTFKIILDDPKGSISDKKRYANLCFQYIQELRAYSDRQYWDQLTEYALKLDQNPYQTVSLGFVWVYHATSVIEILFDQFDGTIPNEFAYAKIMSRPDILGYVELLQIAKSYLQEVVSDLEEMYESNEFNGNITPPTEDQSVKQCLNILDEVDFALLKYQTYVEYSGNNM